MHPDQYSSSVVMKAGKCTSRELLALRLLQLEMFATVPLAWCLSGDGDLDAKLDADAAASIAAHSAVCACCGPLSAHGRENTP